MQSNLLVTIRCLVFNEAPFLRQCLNGFVMQKTTFPFEAIVHDDASTDGSADIIREYAEKYPEIIKPIYEIENQYSKGDGSLGRIMDEHTRGKYITWCEGDDYWIDPNKLQKQVDFLETHPKYGMCYSSAKGWDEDKKLFLNNKKGKKTTLRKIMYGNNSIPTCTVCMRAEIHKRFREEILSEAHNWQMGDLPLWIFCMINSKIKYFRNTTAVYRLRRNSASHSDDIQKRIVFRKNVYEIKDFFKERYNLKFKIRRVESAEFEVYYSIFKYIHTEENWNYLQGSYMNLEEKEFVVKIKYFISLVLHILK